MQYGDLHYLPVTPPFFAILAGLFAILLIVIQLGLLSYAYRRLGLSTGAALLLLFGSLAGSFFNIPVAELPAREVMSGREIEFFGMHYVVPVVERSPSTIIAVNVGGAIIPIVMSLYLLIHHALWLRGAIATAVVTVICYSLSEPVRGIGIAVPVFVPALASAITAIILTREHAAPLAYVAGSLGTLIGADLLNFASIRGLGAPVASIGGAGTFDGIFLTGIVSVLIASLSTWWAPPHPAAHTT